MVAADQVIAVAENRIEKQALEDWIAAHVRPRSSLELRDFFARLDYGRLAAIFGGIAAGTSHERFATIMEAGGAIPAIHAANQGAQHAEERGNQETVHMLRAQSMFMTAHFRFAEDDLGYEW